MPYVVQAKEQEISSDQFQQLAGIIAESPELTLADATLRLHAAHGLLATADQAEAAHLCQRFNALGLESFILQKLVPMSRAQHLALGHPNVEGEIELVTVGRLNSIKQSSTWHVEIAVVSIQGMVGMPGARIKEDTYDEHQIIFVMDVFSATKRWQACIDTSMAIKHFLGSVDLSKARLSAGAEHLAEGNLQVTRFADERDYEQYVLWQYQLAFASRQNSLDAASGGSS
jgi:hypothetical protein